MTTETWVEDARAGLRAAEVDLLAHLPDSTVAPLIDALEDDPVVEAVGVTREEQAVGVLVGGWLAGARGALVCQSSGLATTVNALGSLAVPARTPFVGVVTRRGDLGEFNDAQIPAGYGMDRLLDALGVRNTVLADRDAVAETVRLAADTAFATRSPYVVLLDGRVTGVKDEAEAGAGVES